MKSRKIGRDKSKESEEIVLIQGIDSPKMTKCDERWLKMKKGRKRKPNCRKFEDPFVKI